MGAGQAGRRMAEHDGQRSDSHGKGQVAQVARWLATLKASVCLCLLDGRGMAKRRLNQLIQPPDYRCRSILVRHHYGDGRLWIVNIEWTTSGDEFHGALGAIVVSDMKRNRNRRNYIPSPAILATT